MSIAYIYKDKCNNKLIQTTKKPININAITLLCHNKKRYTLVSIYQNDILIKNIKMFCVDDYKRLTYIVMTLL